MPSAGEKCAQKRWQARNEQSLQKEFEKQLGEAADRHCPHCAGSTNAEHAQRPRALARYAKRFHRPGGGPRVGVLIVPVPSAIGYEETHSDCQVEGYCWLSFTGALSKVCKNAIRSLIFCSSLMPANAILVPGTLALGSLMYSENVASSQVIPEFLLAAE